MIKRITSYVLTRGLSVVPLLLFLMIGTEFGLNLSSKISAAFFDIEITGIHGSVISGNISIQHIKSPQFEADSVDITMEPQTELPFMMINALHLKRLTIKAASLLAQETGSQWLLPTSNILIDQLHLELPMGNIKSLSQVSAQILPEKTIIQAQWENAPLTLKTTKTASNSQLIDLSFHHQTLHFVSKKTPDTLYIQAPPTQPGHFVLFYDKTHHAFTADMDHELEISNDLSINAKLSAQWTDHTGSVHINKLQITDQNKITLINGDLEYTPDKQLISADVKLQDNQLSLTGICLETCDLNLQYNIENLEQISSYLAGDALGSAHIFGSWHQPSYVYQHQSKHFRSKFMSADHLEISGNNSVKKPFITVKGSSIGIQNNLLPIPWRVNMQNTASHLTGKLTFDQQNLPFTGEIGQNGSIKLLTKDVEKPWHFNNDLLISFDQPALAVNIHPVCVQYFNSHLCLSAHLSPEKSYLDIQDIHASGKTTLSLSDPTSYFHIDEYLLKGSLFFSSSETLKLKSNLALTGKKGFIANLIPRFFIPISYEFDSIEVLSSKNGNSLNAHIRSKQGDLNAHLKMNESLSGIEFKVDIPQFDFQEHMHHLKGTHRLLCNLNAHQGQCQGKLILNHSHIEFTQLTPTTELPNDILINSPVNIKKSSSYPLDFMYEIAIENNNTLSIAGLSGPLKGQLQINDTHHQQTQATGQIKIEPATFTLFGKKIPIHTSQITYHHSPLDSPLINIATSKNIRSTHHEMRDLHFSIFGRTPDLNISLKSSNNAMTQLEIVSAFFSGPRNKSWTAETDKVVLSILSDLLSNSHFLGLLKSLSSLEKGLNIDSLSISPQFSMSNDLSDTIMSTKITLKKNLTLNAFLQYQFLLNENKNGMLSFIYQLPSNLLLELYLQINKNTHGVNLLYQQ